MLDVRTSLVDVIRRRRPRFEVRVVPVLDDVRAVLWMDVPAGSTVGCRALFEFDPVPGVTPRVREDWNRDQGQGTPLAASTAPIAVPPRTQFDPTTVLNPRFRVRWATSQGATHETVVPVFG